jgi:PIN domain nuclease of toxin-antitoxin system
MRILLDTHAFLWFVLGDVQLSHNARTMIEDSAHEKLISPAVYWEIAIKIGIGKYVLAEPYETFMDRGINQNGFVILPVEPRHTAVLTTLPHYHRDPFDRLIIAQALVEQISVVSDDEAFDYYPITRHW